MSKPYSQFYSQRSCVLYCLIGLSLWAVVLWNIALPEHIISDWHGWRQSDTQAIANNFAEASHNIFYPQIDWRGSGKGFVETEFQLYTWIVSYLMEWFGQGEWAGQLISLLSMVGAGVFLFFFLNDQYGWVPACAGLLVYVSSRGVIHLATSVQPDTLSFFFYVVGLFYFFRYLANASGRVLFVSCIASCLAVLIKATALHLGLVQFFAVLLIKPELLRSPKLWVSWFVIVATLSLYMFHAHQLYLQYGNTFGVGLDGDSKFPTLNSILDPSIVIKLVRISMTWGVTWFGGLALLVLLVGRRLKTLEIAFMVGNAALLIVSLRYSEHVQYGSHYHISSVLLGAILVSGATKYIASFDFKRIYLLSGLMIFCLLSVVMTTLNIDRRVNHHALDGGEKYRKLAEKLGSFTTNKDLVIVRSSAPQKEGWSGGTNNFEDPRLFYLAGVKGWVLASDDTNYDAMLKLVEQGAKYYAHPVFADTPPQLLDWLNVNGTELFNGDSGTIYSLSQY